MRIATYNIHKGGRQRVHWTKLIEEFGVDTLLVQETYAPSEHLSSSRYAHLQPQAIWEPAEQNRWGSAVFSRCGTLEGIAVPGFSGWVVGAEILGANPVLGSHPILAFSVHAPSRKEAYWKQVNKLLDEIGRVSQGQVMIIGGDFNVAICDRCGSGKPVSKHHLAIQARLADEFGLLNCWSTANPGQVPVQTLRWSSDRAIAYHCDGLFVPKTWLAQLETCQVLAGEVWDALSDHNPVIADFLSPC